MKKFLVIAFTMVVLAVSVLGLFNEPQKVEAFTEFKESSRGSAFFYKGSTAITDWNQFEVGDSFYAIIITNAKTTNGAGQRFVYTEFKDLSNGVLLKYGHFDRAYSTQSDQLAHAIWRFNCVGTHYGNKTFEILNGYDENYAIDWSSMGANTHLWDKNAANPENRRWVLHKQDSSKYGQNAVIMAK